MGSLYPILGVIRGAACLQVIEGVKEERLVLPNWATQTAEHIVGEQIVAVGGGSVRPAPPLEGVEAWAVDLKGRAAVKAIGAVLGDHLHDCPRAMAVLRVIGADINFDLLDRFRVGRNHRGAVPCLAVRGHPVEVIAVGLQPRAVGAHLNGILSLENATVRTAHTTVAWQIRGTSVTRSRACSKHTGSQAEQLERIASELREVCDVQIGERAALRRIFGLNRRQRFALDGNLSADLPGLERQIDALRRLRAYFGVGDDFRLEPGHGCSDRVSPRGKIGHGVEAARVSGGLLRNASLLIGDRNRDAGHHGARGVGHRTFNASLELSARGYGQGY